jgi:hypothetical protein
MEDNSKKGAYIVKSQHPWQRKGERHTFHYGDENSGEAEAKARALIKERAARGWDCTLLHEVTYAPEEHPPLFKITSKPNPNLDMNLEDYLTHKGARYIEPYFAICGGELTAVVAARLNISPTTLKQGWRENNSLWHRREWLRERRYDNIELRQAHREAYLVELNRMLSDGQHDKIPLFFTIIHSELVRDLSRQNLTTVGDLAAAAQLISEHPTMWMPNDADYVSFCLARIAEQAWGDVFWFISNPMHALKSDPTFVPLGPNSEQITSNEDTDE